MQASVDEEPARSAARRACSQRWRRSRRPGAARARRADERRARSSAAPCATCCSGRAPRELDVVVVRRRRPLRRRRARRRSSSARRAPAAALDAPRALRHRRASSGTAGGSTSPSGAPSPTPAPERCPRCARAPARRTCSAGTSPSTRSPSPSAARGAGELIGRRARARGSRAGRACGCCTSASFIDDPTRLLRLARYSARLGFEVEPHTPRWPRRGARERRAGHRLRRARSGAELRLALQRSRTRSRRCRRSASWACCRRSACGSSSTAHARAGRSSCSPPTAHGRTCLLLACLLGGLGHRGRSARAGCVALLDGLEFARGRARRRARARPAAPVSSLRRIAAAASPPS